MRKAKGGGATGSGNTPMTESDKSAQQIRALQTSESNNKTCLDCGQRGPTYVNMTIGSFVCTKCSGMLRGINPPHRIKSISMSSFSAEEIDFLRSRGNLWCQLVWLGLYDGHRSPEGMDEERVKEFIIEKYEKKRYYVDPSTIANTLPQPAKSNSGGWTPNEASSGRSNLIGSTLTGRLATGGGHAQTSRANADASTSSVVSRPTNSQPQPSESSLQSKPDSSFLADFSAFSSGPIPNPTPMMGVSNANQGVDPFGSLSKSQPNTGTPSNFNATPETNDFFADFDGAQFDTPTMATPIPKPQASISHNTPGSSVPSSALGATSAWGATPTSKPLMQPKQQIVKQQATRPQSTPITNNQTAADKYAALKDLDEIFKSTITLTDSPSGTTGVSIFGSSPIPASNLSKSLFEKESLTKGTGQSSIFDSTGNNDSWATSFGKLENTTSSNTGTTWDWADRNGAKPRANSAAGSTGVATSPVNPFTGAGNMSQLNTSPWPTTGTSPVNNPPASVASNWPPESVASSNSKNPETSASTGFDSDPFATFNLQSGSKGNAMDVFGTGSQTLDDPFATTKAPSAQGNGNFDAFFQTLTSSGNGAMGNGNPWTSSNVVQNDLFSVNNPGIPNSSKNSTNPFL